ncbi:FecR family protein [Niabella pedocola]|uniref:FecR family protein n=1 Tax=Niabella pedocola TaxID=1752077 RepID=A0ABS8Q0S1_9BACT|nr:FecR family protein [Niabella pedocola]MCD2425766.1 FecR family protein [Niabella pedocola]
MKRNRLSELQRAASDVIVTNKGAHINHMLPNGSKVWVNVSSRLTYDHTSDAKK